MIVSFHMDLSTLPQVSPLMQYALLIWAIAWKGIALWRTSKNDQKNWFIAILVINTLGILEIVYLFVFSKKKMVLGDLFFWKSKS